MNAETLSALAAKAIIHVIRYRDGPNVDLEQGYEAFIANSVEKALPLREIARDQEVANLEIACDAAVAFIEDYNKVHPDNMFNVRWFYINVQALLTIDLKPALLAEPVDRLESPHDDEEVEENIDEQESPAVDHPPAARSNRALKKGKAPAATMTSDGGSGNAGPSKKEVVRWARWTDEEIELMIQLRLDGMSNIDIAEILGRPYHGVESKWSYITHEERTPYVQDIHAATVYRSALKVTEARQTWVESYTHQQLSAQSSQHCQTVHAVDHSDSSSATARALHSDIASSLAAHMTGSMADQIEEDDILGQHLEQILGCYGLGRQD
ncbi:hypothetical protein VPNG_06737 [Cytospora leucostoma]|uniref:Myb-like domain-containing protein n=1 Tax=Cytospora leucostoma TaxID=1230097 RepID=A0A423WT34_9PEZI|nr:hypothetical protein VPNG_06737 [Cytospora leucostoma]